MKLTVRELVFLALCTAAMFVSQVALSFLPNIELVSLLVIVYTHAFRRKVLYILYVFALLEGLLYGFTTWWLTYLYVWTILAGLAWAFRRMESPLGWAVLSGAFGLAFGALRSRNRAAAWIVSVLLFSFYHVWQYAVIDPLYLLTAVLYIPASIALNWSYERSGSIWAPIFYHMLTNAVGISAL